MKTTSRPSSPAAPVLLGVVFAMATFFQGWQVADPVLGVLALYLIARGTRPPRWCLLLALALVPGLFFTQNPIATSATLIRVVTIPTVLTWARGLPEWKPERFTIGVVLELAMQTIALLTLIRLPRLSGLTTNASELGQVGLMVFLLTPAQPRIARWGTLATSAITLAAAASRIPLAGVALFAIFKRQRTWLARAAAVGAIGVTVPMLTGNMDRFGGDPATGPAGDTHERDGWARGGFYEFLPPAIAKDIAQRIQTVKGAQDGSTAAIVTCQQAWSWYGDGYECQRGTLSWHGYGTGSYGASAGFPRPHITMLVTIYELGIFAAVPAGLAVWALWTRRIPWELAAMLGAVWLGVDEPLAIPLGHYMLAAVCAVWIPLRNRSERAGERPVEAREYR